MKLRKSRYLFPLVATIVCIFVAVFLLINRQYVVDQISVWQYHPGGEVASLASRTHMSDKGKFYFYASQPSLQGAQAFNKTCGRQEQRVAILGCYSGQYIYVYNVTDAKLDGIREVTAAHEMLHAAYARLDDSRKKEINTLLEAEYDRVKNDEKLAERMAFYARTEPGERDNELHSVVGTEIKNISPQLEEYYKAYFTDRSKVVELYTAYAQVFLDLQSRGDALSAQLTELGDAIENDSLQYNRDVSQFNEDVEHFKQRSDEGSFSSQDEYDTERSSLISRAEQLDVRQKTINDEVERYEVLRLELQGIASQSDALNRSIDSSLVPAPSL